MDNGPPKVTNNPTIVQKLVNADKNNKNNNKKKISFKLLFFVRESTGKGFVTGGFPIKGLVMPTVISLP